MAKPNIYEQAALDAVKPDPKNPYEVAAANAAKEKPKQAARPSLAARIAELSRRSMMGDAKAAAELLRLTPQKNLPPAPDRQPAAQVNHLIPKALLPRPGTMGIGATAPGVADESKMAMIKMGSGNPMQMLEGIWGFGKAAVQRPADDLQTGANTVATPAAQFIKEKLPNGLLRPDLEAEMRKMGMNGKVWAETLKNLDPTQMPEFVAAVTAEADKTGQSGVAKMGRGLSDMIRRVGEGDEDAAAQVMGMFNAFTLSAAVGGLKTGLKPAGVSKALRAGEEAIAAERALASAPDQIAGGLQKSPPKTIKGGFVEPNLRGTFQQAPKTTARHPAATKEPAGVPQGRQIEGQVSPMGDKSEPGRVRSSAEGHGFTETRMDPKNIDVYPGLQYKRAGVNDPVNAVTGELKGVTKYDQATAGPLSIWERTDGKHYAINGHHRRELAIRTGEPDVPVRIFKESEGIDFKTARALGAFQNLRDGKGTAIDATTILRDLKTSPDELKQFGLNTKTGIARDAISLMKLDNDAIRLVEDGQVPEAVAAAIADAGLEPRRQLATLKLAAKSDLETRTQGALLADRAKNAPMVDRSGGNGDLFGEIDEGLALAEQAKLADAAMRRLSQSQRALTAFDRAKAVGSTFIDKDAQSQAAAIMEFGRKVLATDADAARVLEQEARNYAQNPTKQQLGRSVDAIFVAAESAAERRLGEIGGLGQGDANGIRGRAGSGQTPGVEPRNVNPPDAGKLFDVDPELKLVPDESPKVINLKGMGKAIGENFRKSLRESVEKTGKLPNIERNSNLAKAYEARVANGEPRTVATLDKVLAEADRPAENTKPSQGGIFGDEPVKGGLFEMDSPNQGAGYGKNSERIPWKAEPGGFTGQISDLVLDIGAIPERNIAQGKRTKAGAAGVYYPGTAQTTIRRWNDLDTAVHEAAHGLDDKFGLVADWALDKNPSPFDKELQWFWERGGSSGPGKPLVYNRAEGVAEFLRAYLVNPTEAVKRAPQFASYMLSKLPNEVVNKLNTLGTKLRQLHGADSVQKTKAAIQTETPATPGMVQRVQEFFNPNKTDEGFKTSLADKARAQFTDDLAPFVSAAREAAKRRGMDLKKLRPSNNPETLARGLAYFPHRFEAVMRYGMTNKSGKVVTPPAESLLRSLDRSTAKTLESDIKDLEALLVSERTIEKADQIAARAAEELGEYETRVQGEINQRLELFEATLRKEYEAKFQRKAGELAERGRQRRAQGKGLSAEAHNRRNKRIDANIEKQLQRIREEHEVEIETTLSNRREKWLEIVKTRVDREAVRIARRVEIEQARLTGAGYGVQNAAEIAGDAVRILKSDPKKYARLSVAAAQYRDWADAVLRYGVEKGRISEESYRIIKEQNQQYAAMQRILDDPEAVIERKGGMAGAKEPVKKFEGSTATIASPLKNLLEGTFTLMKEADRNEVISAFTALLDQRRGMYQGNPANLAAIGQRVDAGTPGAIRVFVKGEAQHWLLEEGVSEALRNVGGKSLGAWGKVFSLPNNLLRKGVTVMPGFQIRNRIRDTQATFMTSGHKFKRSDWRIKATSEEKRLYDFFGGGIGRGHYLDGAVDFYRVRDRLINDMRMDRGTILLDPRRMMESLGEAYFRNETAPRMAEIRAAMREADSKFKTDYDKNLYAAQSARDLIDFSQGGKTMKIISRFFVPFANAQVQGQRAMLKMAADHPTRFAARWAATAVAPTVAEYAWNSYQGDIEEWRQLPAWQRDLFWNLKVGDNLWLRIPKPFEAGVIASAFGRSLDFANGNREAFEGYAGNLLKSFLVVDETTPLGPAATYIEAKTNMDLHFDKTIVPVFEENLALELREFDKNASEFSQFLQTVIPIDARKADFVVRSLFGEAGNFALYTSDLAGGDKFIPNSTHLNRMFGIFASGPGPSAQVVKDVLEAAKLSGTKANPLGMLIDAFYESDNDEDRQAAAWNLIAGAQQLKVKLDAATKGQTGALKYEAMKKVLTSSDYNRETLADKPKSKTPSRTKQLQELGIPTRKGDKMGLGSILGK